jgi:hypothetical protein
MAGMGGLAYSNWSGGLAYVIPTIFLVILKTQYVQKNWILYFLYLKHKYEKQLYFSKL